MAERSYLWDGSSDTADTGDVGPYNEETWRSILKALMGTSLIEDAAIIPDSGLSGSAPLYVEASSPNNKIVRVTIGSALVYGTFYENTTSKPFTIPDNNDTNSRIDVIAIRWDSTAKTVRLKHIAGAPATTPVAPSLADTSAIKEIPLAYLIVDSRFDTIGADKIRNIGKYVQNGSYDISVLKNSGSSTIQSGYIVEVDPDNDKSVRLARVAGNVLGVTVGDIPAAQFGLVCTRGTLDVYASSSVTRGEDAILATTNGTITSQTVEHGAIAGQVLETTTAAGYASILFNPRTIGEVSAGRLTEIFSGNISTSQGSIARVDVTIPVGEFWGLYIDPAGSTYPTSMQYIHTDILRARPSIGAAFTGSTSLAGIASINSASEQAAAALALPMPAYYFQNTALPPVTSATQSTAIVLLRDDDYNMYIIGGHLADPMPLTIYRVG